MAATRQVGQGRVDWNLRAVRTHGMVHRRAKAAVTFAEDPTTWAPRGACFAHRKGDALVRTWARCPVSVAALDPLRLEYS